MTSILWIAKTLRITIGRFLIVFTFHGNKKLIASEIETYSHPKRSEKLHGSIMCYSLEICAWI